MPRELLPDSILKARKAAIKKNGAKSVLSMAELNARWRKKKEHLEKIAANIRSLRYNLTRDLKSDDEKTRLTALVISVMDCSAERVGNEDSESNGHFGVTGFQKKHVKVNGNTITLKYKGKSGVEHQKSFSDPLIARVMKQAIKDSPNKFVFCTSDGFRIRADKVNRYLNNYHITAKDIRGYCANTYILNRLKNYEIIKANADLPEEKAQKKRKAVFNKAVKYAAEKVGHGPATLKNHYLMPEVSRDYIEYGRIINLSDFYSKGGEVKGKEKSLNKPKISVKEKKPCGCKHKLNKPLITKLKKGGLIAPNDKPSNLTAQQYELVRTPAFKKWFGDWENDPENSSKVVDENGEPLVVYHGSDYKFDKFDKRFIREGSFGKGFYFSEKKSIARGYGKNVMPYFMCIKFPANMKVGIKYAFDNSKIEKKGYDGLIIQSNFKRGDTIIAFNPTQIKLADGTNTTFDLKSPDIRYKKGGEVEKSEIEKQVDAYIKEGIFLSKGDKVNTGTVNISRFTGPNSDIFPSQLYVDKSGVRKWKKRIKAGERPAILVEFKPIDDRFYILDAHHRLTAYDQLGFTEVPVIDKSGKLNFDQFKSGGYITPKIKNLKVYHGTAMDGLKEITFGSGPRSAGMLGRTKEVKSPTIFFTKDKDIAELFAHNRVEYLKEKGIEGKATVYERYITINHPADFTNIEVAEDILDKAGINVEEEILGTISPFKTYLSNLISDGAIQLSDLWQIVDNPEFVERLKQAGYDGAIFMEPGDRGISYAIFDPKQASEKKKMEEGGELDDKKIKILYLHGIGATPESDHVTILANDNVEMIAPYLDYDRKDLFKVLSHIIERVHPDGIVGHSAGGFLAFYLSNKFRIPSLMFNPAFNCEVKSMHLVPEKAMEIPFFNKQVAVVGSEDQEVSTADQLMALESVGVVVFIEKIGHDISDEVKLKYFNHFIEWFKNPDNSEKFEKGGLIAPNGKPSNLTPAQYKLVRTPEFKEWFGDWEHLANAVLSDPGLDEVTLKALSESVSKIIDENGEPLVVYRGQQDERPFNVDRASNLKGIYFSEMKEETLKYGPIIKGYFLNIRNPYVPEMWNMSVLEGYHYSKLINEGYDGGIWMRKGKKYEIIAFHPEQIKLADETKSFDSKSPSVVFGKGGKVDTSRVKKKLSMIYKRLKYELSRRI